MIYDYEYFENLLDDYEICIKRRAHACYESDYLLSLEEPTPSQRMERAYNYGLVDMYDIKIRNLRNEFLKALETTILEFKENKIKIIKLEEQLEKVANK